jgi:hypothetical protein
MSDEALPAIARSLRAHIADHNFRVALLTLLTLIGALALWFLLHAALHWLTLLAVTVVKGLDARAPAFVDQAFWIAAAVLLVLAWIDRRFRPDDRPRDHKSAAEIAWEILLAIPRATFAIGSTLSAWQNLAPRELTTAAELVDRLGHDRRMPLHALPLEIPNERLRLKILFALQLLQIVEIRREDRELWISLSPLRPASLLRKSGDETTALDRQKPQAPRRAPRGS